MERRTITLERIILFLLETPMFEGLSAGELSEIVHIMQMKRMRDGQLLFREGEEGDGWYVIFEGEVLVTKTDELGPSREITCLGPRSCVGEMAVLDGRPRSATVAAKGEVTVFRFPRYEFEGLLADDNLAAYRLVLEMAKVLCRRLRAINGQLYDMINQQDISAGGMRRQIEPLVADSTRAE